MGSARIAGLTGSMTALVTPFRQGRIDEAAFVALCERQIRGGTSALVPCGTTGEAPTLSHAEQARLIELAVQTADGRVPVIAGAGSNCTFTTIQLVKDAEMHGAAAVLCIVPYYNRPTQAGLFEHFKLVQASTNIPVILYDVPARTGTALALDTIVALSRLPNIAGIKDAAGDLAKATRLRYSVAPEFLRLCGDDMLVGAHLALGCHGVVSVTANVAPGLCADLLRAWSQHDRAGFDALNTRLGPLNSALFAETNPIGVKWALAHLGLIDGELRLPLTELDAAYRDAVVKVLEGLSGPESEFASADWISMRKEARAVLEAKKIQC